ncbi:MAG TPA: hypothetical protein VF916_12150, partial [Ktedonobacterales bacterium]
MRLRRERHGLCSLSPSAVVADFDPRPVTILRNEDTAVLSSAVPNDVRHALTHSPRQDGFGGGWKADGRRGLAIVLIGDAGGRQDFLSGAELARQGWLAVAGDSLTYLLECGASRLFDVADLDGGAFWGLADKPPGQLALECNQREVVAEQIVQITCDPQPLFGHRGETRHVFPCDPQL